MHVFYFRRISKYENSLNPDPDVHLSSGLYLIYSLTFNTFLDLGQHLFAKKFNFLFVKK